MNVRNSGVTELVTAGHKLPERPIAESGAGRPMPSGARLPASPAEIAEPDWFAVRSQGNAERSTRDRLRQLRPIAQVLVPMEIKRSYTRGQPSRKVATLYLPGFVFVRLVLTDEAWHLIHDTRGVVGIVGVQITRRVLGRTERYVHPVRLRQPEVTRLLNYADAEGKIEQANALPPDLKDRLLRVLDGPFTSFSGICEECDPERGRLKVGVDIFGRTCPIELDYSQVALAD